MMKANSRNSIRWGAATAVVALALGVLPLTFDGDAIAGKTALADAGGNGRLVAVKSESLNDDTATNSEEKKPPVSDHADDADEGTAIGANPDLGSADDGDRIRDDSDTASVDGSANDGDTMRHPAAPVATAAEGNADTIGETF
jgi:hypothetical protein